MPILLLTFHRTPITWISKKKTSGKTKVFPSSRVENILLTSFLNGDSRINSDWSTTTCSISIDRNKSEMTNNCFACGRIQKVEFRSCSPRDLEIEISWQRIEKSSNWKIWWFFIWLGLFFSRWGKCKLIPIIDQTLPKGPRYLDSRPISYGLQFLSADRFQQCTQTDQTLFVKNLFLVTVFDAPFRTRCTHIRWANEMYSVISGTISVTHTVSIRDNRAIWCQSDFPLETPTFSPALTECRHCSVSGVVWTALSEQSQQRSSLGKLPDSWKIKFVSRKHDGRSFMWSLCSESPENRVIPSQTLGFEWRKFMSVSFNGKD
jgi:hypothetical protein